MHRKGNKGERMFLGGSEFGLFWWIEGLSASLEDCGPLLSYMKHDIWEYSRFDDHFTSFSWEYNTPLKDLHRSCTLAQHLPSLDNRLPKYWHPNNEPKIDLRPSSCPKYSHCSNKLTLSQQRHKLLWWLLLIDKWWVRKCRWWSEWLVVLLVFPVVGQARKWWLVRVDHKWYLLHYRSRFGKSQDIAVWVVLIQLSANRGEWCRWSHSKECRREKS